MTENFIGIYENAFTKEYCERVINYFEAMKLQGFAKDRVLTHTLNRMHKDDEVLFGASELTINLEAAGTLYDEFNHTFWTNCYAPYADKYSVLKETPQHGSYNFKVQKTAIGGGYHVWHCESNTRERCNRLLAWALYLNDVEEGGETEFLYQHLRVKPKQGTFLIWPAGITHVHRGNPPISNEKYIVTGWMEF